jgi:hypothetical protein
MPRPAWSVALVLSAFTAGCAPASDGSGNPGDNAASDNSSVNGTETLGQLRFYDACNPNEGPSCVLPGSLPRFYAGDDLALWDDANGALTMIDFRKSSRPRAVPSFTLHASEQIIAIAVVDRRIAVLTSDAKYYQIYRSTDGNTFEPIYHQDIDPAQPADLQSVALRPGDPNDPNTYFVRSYGVFGQDNGLYVVTADRGAGAGRGVREVFIEKNTRIDGLTLGANKLAYKNQLNRTDDSSIVTLRARTWTENAADGAPQTATGAIDMPAPSDNPSLSWSWSNFAWNGDNLLVSGEVTYMGQMNSGLFQWFLSKGQVAYPSVQSPAGYPFIVDRGRAFIAAGDSAHDALLDTLTPNGVRTGYEPGNIVAIQAGGGYAYWATDDDVPIHKPGTLRRAPLPAP